MPRTQGDVSACYDGVYSDNGYNGTGVDIYVMDTGVKCDHTDWAPGQCEFLVGFLDGEIVTKDLEDTNGHGTHCAGTAASPTYCRLRSSERRG